MNGQQQRERHTAVTKISNEVMAIADRFDEELGNARAESRDAVSAERTHRMRLADEQRSYVDGEDRKLRVCCQERWDATAEAQGRIIARIDALRNRGFWSRLNWLVTGR